jgi:hypothetical protein
MRIAQIAPLFESVPPRLYGGTERVVSYLTEELTRQGHQVTLFASGDSMTSAELVPCTPRALRLDSDVRDPIPHHILMLDKVRERAARIRHPALPRRLPALSAVPVRGRPDCDDVARPAGSCRSHAVLSLVFGHAADLHLERATGAASRREFCRAVRSRVAPDVPIALGTAARPATFYEPRVLIRRMIGDEVQDHPDPARVRFRDQPFEIDQVAEDRIDVDIIGDVVAEVGHWRPKDRRNPDRIGAEIDEVGQSLGDAL